MLESLDWNEECGVFGIVGHSRAAELTFLGLYALQHRGQEGAGIVTFDGDRYHEHKDLGLVNDVFDRPILDGLEGESALGHTRYSTTGSTVLPNVQPILANLRNQMIALAHNGNLVDARVIREELESSGSIFQTSMDSEVVLHLMARSRQEEIAGQLSDALDRIHGAYSLVLMAGGVLFAAKDPRGIRPLCIGRRSDGAWVVTSESCALDIVDASFERAVEPGELVMLRSGEEPTTIRRAAEGAATPCIFEAIYFSRPDSKLFGRSAGASRIELGRQLAREKPAPGAEVVISVPDSSNAAAQGFAEESGVPLGFGLIRNHYVGRTFIDPSPAIRDFSARIKYNAVPDVISGRSVVVVDDSIVRGNTVSKLVSMLRSAGAREVHFRVSSAPIVSPCYYGIDTPTEGELVAAQLDVDDICRQVGADSLGYLSVPGMRSAVAPGRDFCTACFDRNYPVPVVEAPDKGILEKNR